MLAELDRETQEFEAQRERIRSAYGATTYDRLQALKQKYDPGNLFHLNQNIPPN